MLDIFEKIGDLIAPPHPAVAQIRAENIKTFARFYDPERVGDATALACFTIPRVHAAIAANKFCDYEKAGLLLSVLLSNWLDSLPERPTILVPIPLGPKREKERGYNQVTRVLSHIKKNFVTVKPLLLRPVDTMPQTDLGRTARLENIKNAFAVTSSLPQDLSGHRIIICDDVITTGATLAAAKAALTPYLPADCELLCVAFAH